MNANTLEHWIHRSEPNRGFTCCYPIPLTAVSLIAGGALTNSSDPQLDITSGFASIQWAAADTDGIYIPINLPGTFVDRGDLDDQIQLVIAAVYWGSGSDATEFLDADLVLKPRFAAATSAINPTRAEYVASATADPVVSATAANGAAFVFTDSIVAAQEFTFTWDLSAYAAFDGGTFRLDITDGAGSQQAPATNNQVSIHALELRYLGHASLTRKAERIHGRE